MARKRRSFFKGSFYHIFNRGVAKENIFLDDSDFRFYLYKIKDTLKNFPVNIHAYNLIPNHIHYLMEQTTDCITPGKFIGSLHTSFSSFINRKYSRVGHLFQDRYKANLIKEDLLSISFYINLNKILEKLQHVENGFISQSMLENLLKEAKNDAWSSYPVYLGIRDDYITTPNFILGLISDDIKKARQEYERLAKEFLMSGFFLKTRNLRFE